MKDESHIVGREDFANKLVSQLIDGGDCANLRVISVFGEGAIGKTALVRSVCNRADIKNHFYCRAWVRVGPEPNLVHLMVNLLKQLRPLDWELRGVDRMDKKKLSEVLLSVSMKCCYLIVLDDLSDLYLMDRLIMALADSRNGSRVIVTTRNTEIPSSIYPWYFEHLELSPLDLEQSNKLLEESSGTFDGDDRYGELPRLKERILRKSGGSPSKILLLGGLLSATTLSGCTNLVNQLPDHPTLQDVVHLSINDLPEWDISRGGEAKAQINVLEAGQERSETNAQEAQMEIAPAEPHQRNSASDSSMPCGIQQLCSYVSFNTMKLRTRAGEIPALLKLLVPKRDSSLLRILDLQGVYKPLLSEELGNKLPNLKYLGLRWTLLERLPKSVGNLSRLETLDLKYTNISDLPNSILEAENLRHLYMTEVVLDVATCHQLESKKSLNCNIQTIWGLVIDDKSPMLEVLRKLTGLIKLALTWDGQSVWEATKHILNLKMLKSLRLRLKDPSDKLWVEHEMSDMSRLMSLSNLYLLGYLGMQSLLESHIPPNLKVLTLSMSRLDVDPMGVLGKLKCLTTLRLFALSYNGRTISVSEGTFPSLRVLKLWRLYNLTEWTIQANAMPCLADLEIKDCTDLTKIDGLQHIKTLEEITLVRVPDEVTRSVRDMQPNGPIIVRNW
ncbi:hypothetical protein BT93_J1969 [Corymbia citriodora subsp. variegata]|nr:hypothetical protein BT93_J1969 [Corymbia citriodora subsp. variegata]